MATANNNNTNTIGSPNNDVYMAPLNDYEALFKIDLNFDEDVSDMNDTVLSDYITRVIQGHPYYVSLENVVDIIIDEDTNKVTLIVSNKEVGDHIVNTTNNNAAEINDIYNNVAPLTHTNKRLGLINANYKDAKYILEHTNKNGEPVMYEYEFKGFTNARSLYHDESIKLNGERIRHFLKNEDGNPFFYDEYMNSTIVYSPEEKMNFMDKRVKSLENRLQHTTDPNNIGSIKNMAEKVSNNIPNNLPNKNEVSLNKPKLCFAPLNYSSNLINTNIKTGSLNSVSTTTSTTPSTTPVISGKTLNVNGVNSDILGNTHQVFQ
jgi:hypothetical protein